MAQSHDTDERPMGSSDSVPDPMSSTEDLRLAMVWYPGLLGGNSHPPTGLCEHPESGRDDYGGTIVQEIRGGVMLPARVSLEGLAPPPEAALVSLPGSPRGTWSTGQLVVYRDGNGNGQLDLRNLAHATHDMVLGASSKWLGLFGIERDTVSYVVYYATEGSSDYPDILPGYNLFRDTVFPDGENERTRADLKTEIPIEQDLTPRVSTLDCTEMCWVERPPFSCPDSPRDLPSSLYESCSGSGAGAYFEWSRPQCDGCTCWSNACYYEWSEELEAAGAWPCSP